MSKQHIGIFGPGQSGKSTLAQAISKNMALKHGFSSLVLDPTGDKWPYSKLTTDDEEKFWDVVWKSERCLVVVEEATEMIARDKKLTKNFTRIRHLGHKLLVIGHTGTTLLPIMREQIHFLHLFRQPEESAKIWANTTSEPRLMQATDLAQYEFLRFVHFGDKKTRKHLVEKATLKL